MDKDKTPLLLLIGGASGSGKSTIAELLAEQVALDGITSALIRMDDYYPNNDYMPLEERGKINYDDPKIFDYNLLASNLEQLKGGKPIVKPKYDFENHTRKGSEEVKPSDLIILEGIYALYDQKIVGLSDYRIYVNTPLECCMTRRMRRDLVVRGRNPDEVITRLEKDVIPMFWEHVFKTKANAISIIEWDYSKTAAVDVIVGYVYKHFYGVKHQV
jgi:uridine kinase